MFDSSLPEVGELAGVGDAAPAQAHRGVAPAERQAKLAAPFAAGLIGGPQTERAIDALVDQVGPGAAPRPHDVEPVSCGGRLPVG